MDKLPASDEDKRKAALLTRLVDLHGKYWRNIDELGPDGVASPFLSQIAGERNDTWREVLESFGLDPDLAWYPMFGPYAESEPA